MRPEKTALILNDIKVEEIRKKQAPFDYDKESQTNNFGQDSQASIDTIQDDIMSARERSGFNQRDMAEKMKYMIEDGSKTPVKLMTAKK